MLLAPRDGRVLDVEATLDALADAVFTGSAEAAAAFVPRPAPPTTNAVRVAGAIDIGTVLGSAESLVRGDDPTRTHNLRLTARRLDGVLILPGAGFDARAELAELYELGRFRPGRAAEGAVDPIEPRSHRCCAHFTPR